MPIISNYIRVQSIARYDNIVYSLNMIYDTTEIMKKFGEKVKKYRTLAGLTQEQLAEKCDCSAQTISGTETGYSFPSSKVLFNLSVALEVPLVYFFNFDEDNYITQSESVAVVSKLLNKMNKEQRNLVLKMLKALSE